MHDECIDEINVCCSQSLFTLNLIEEFLSKRTVPRTEKELDDIEAEQLEAELMEVERTEAELKEAELKEAELKEAELGADSMEAEEGPEPKPKEAEPTEVKQKEAEPKQKEAEPKKWRKNVNYVSEYVDSRWLICDVQFTTKLIGRVIMRSSSRSRIKVFL